MICRQRTQILPQTTLRPFVPSRGADPSPLLAAQPSVENRRRVLTEIIESIRERVDGSPDGYGALIGVAAKIKSA